MGRRGDDFDCFSKSEVEFRLLLEYCRSLGEREPYELEIYHKMISYL